MLKYLHIKNRRIPVPVPIRNLDEAIAWVAQTFATDEKIITRVVLDGEDIDLDKNDFSARKLSEASELLMHVESHRELSKQSIEVIQNFCTIVLRRLKPLAVFLYNYKEKNIHPSLSEFLEDMAFIRDIRTHLGGILDRYHEELAPFEGLSALCEKVMRDFNMNVQVGNWGVCSEILLNRLEPFMRELQSEIDILNGKILNSDKLFSFVG